MKRILFVDAEEAVLEGINTALRRLRRKWDLVFARDANQALAEIARAPFDVVVTDLRIPGVDGVGLLKRVREMRPRTARIVLTGPVDRATSQRLWRVAHQCLAKPVEPTAVHDVIERITSLQDLLQDERLLQLAGEIGQLPTLPDHYLRLTTLLDSGDDVSLERVGAIVESDPAFSTKILQVVNSAFFGLAQPMTSIRQAICYLGIEPLRNLVLWVELFSSGPAHGTVHIERMRNHSLATGRLARQLLGEHPNAEAGFTAGVLTEVGALLLASRMPDRYVRTCASAQQLGVSIHEVEQAEFGVTHAELGAYLIGLWGLPWSIVESVAEHHRPERCAGRGLDPVSAVCLASSLVGANDTAGHGEALTLARVLGLERTPEVRQVLERTRTPLALLG